MIARLREDFPDLPEQPDAKTVFTRLRELRTDVQEHARAEAEKLRVQLASHGDVTHEAVARATAVTEAAGMRLPSFRPVVPVCVSR